MEQRDVLVVGGSAGGLEALAQLIPPLPPDLGATVYVVVHIPANGASQLPEILSRWGGLAAAYAVHGEVPLRGRIYVAPPDHHLILGPKRLSVLRGPKENGHRPAIDPLFRSAADIHGRRVIGVILSGSLDDGVAGLAQVKAAGGVAVVQDPQDAVIPIMPRTALAAVEVDHVLPAGEMAALIVRLVREPLPEAAGAGLLLPLTDPPGAPPNVLAEGS
jgi:two-component system chemotaxis response regulator CheB